MCALQTNSQPNHMFAQSATRSVPHGLQLRSPWRILTAAVSAMACQLPRQPASRLHVLVLLLVLVLVLRLRLLPIVLFILLLWKCAGLTECTPPFRCCLFSCGLDVDGKSFTDCGGIQPLFPQKTICEKCTFLSLPQRFPGADCEVFSPAAASAAAASAAAASAASAAAAASTASCVCVCLCRYEMVPPCDRATGSTQRSRRSMPGSGLIPGV